MTLTESAPISMQQLQAAAYRDGDLLIWTIYERPRDFPESYVVRPFSSKLGAPLAVHFDHAQLEYVRDAMRALGLICVARSPDDEPQILESWL